MTLWSVCTVVCVLTAVSAVTGESVVVDTRYGALRGTRKTTGPDSYVDQFLSIPFARPPVGYLRFHKPVANEAWTGIRDATTAGPMCPQPPLPPPYDDYTLAVSEDCLYLNVFTPKASNDSGPLPVMVWIHGGGYFVGTGSGLDLSPLAAKGVVVVTINYRLGALGFLSTEDSTIPGNYGIWDQIRALEWVRDAISNFNGDPNDVTIFGESAGSSSVSILVLSHETNGLFQKAIMESGVSLCFWAVSYPRKEPEPKRTAAQFSTLVGCDGGDSQRLLACLRTKDAEQIANASVNIFAESQGALFFRPIPETTFGQTGVFAAVPKVVLKTGSFNNVTVIRGFNSDESATRAYAIDPEDDGITMEEFKNMTRFFVGSQLKQTINNVDMDRIVKLLLEAYVAGVTDPIQLRDSFFQLQSDVEMVVPTITEAEMSSAAHVKQQFVYRFSYRSANRLNKPWQGTVHGDEIHYVFGYPIIEDVMWNNFVSTWTEDDKRVADDVMTLWSNFAKYGNPTPDGSAGTKWLPWEQATPRLLDIGLQSRMTDYPITSKFHLWNVVISKLIQGEEPEGIIG